MEANIDFYKEDHCLCDVRNTRHCFVINQIVLFSERITPVTLLRFLTKKLHQAKNKCIDVYFNIIIYNIF